MIRSGYNYYNNYNNCNTPCNNNSICSDASNNSCQEVVWALNDISEKIDCYINYYNTYLYGKVYGCDSDSSSCSDSDSDSCHSDSSDSGCENLSRYYCGSKKSKRKVYKKVYKKKHKKHHRKHKKHGKCNTCK
jgi:hypothetical protein